MGTKLENIISKTKQGVQNWAIDTSAKVAVFAPLMGAMESYNGLNAGQILKARATSALVDGVVARVYTKTADYLGEKTKPITPKISRNSIKMINTARTVLKKEELDLNAKKKVYKAVEGVRNYITDTFSMIGVYTPVYAGILKLNGADNQQIGSALLMGAGIAAVTSRPFRKYALMPWRKLCGYKK